MWWHVPVIPATREAEAGDSLEPRRWRLQWADIVPLHSSLGDRVRLSQKKRKEKKSPMESLQKAIKLSEFSQTAGYKIKIQKSTACLYSSNDQIFQFWNSIKNYKILRDKSDKRHKTCTGKTQKYYWEKLIKTAARHSGSHLYFQHFGRLRRVDDLRLEVRDQPDQQGETPSLLKIQKN